MCHPPAARLSRLAVALLLGAAAGCAEFPALDDTVEAGARAAPYPELVPLETLLAQVPPQRITPATGAGERARAAALRARAERLRGAVLDPATRARMARGVR